MLKVMLKETDKEGKGDTIVILVRRIVIISDFLVEWEIMCTSKLIVYEKKTNWFLQNFIKSSINRLSFNFLLIPSAN